MLKLVKKALVSLLFVGAFHANAGLITPNTDPLSDNTFISLGGYDWTWASTYNIQFYFCEPVDGSGSPINYDDYLNTVYTGSACAQEYSNQLMAASYHNGWSFFEDLLPQQGSIESYLTQLAFDNNILLEDLFTDTNGNKIQSFSYWNTSINTTSGFQAPFASDWTGKARFDDFPFLTQSIFANTIYVRESQPVPEPSTLLIFAIGLIGLAARLRTAK